MLKIKRDILLNQVILLFAFFPLLPNQAKGLPVIFLLLISILNYKSHKINYKWFLINSSIFILYLISFLYTENINFGMKKVETSLSILILPLVFFIITHRKEITNDLKIKFMKLFVISTTLFSAITLLSILADNKTEYYKDFYSNKFRIIVENIPLIGQHPIYASIFIGVSLIFAFFLYKLGEYSYNGVNKLYIILYTLINISLIIMLSSRGVIISLIMLLFIHLIRVLLSTRNYKHVFKIFATILICMTLLFVFNRRMGEMLKFDTYINLNTNYSNAQRVNIYQCAIKVIKEKWLFGHGIGDAQDVLNSCYKEKSQLLYTSSYNSHNQYLDFSIKLGLFGLLVFLIFLFYNLSKAIVTGNEVLFYIIVFYCINFLTENILVRQSGLILFIFIIHFLRTEKKKLNQNL